MARRPGRRARARARADEIDEKAAADAEAAAAAARQATAEAQDATAGLSRGLGEGPPALMDRNEPPRGAARGAPAAADGPGAVARDLHS